MTMTRGRANPAGKPGQRGVLEPGRLAVVLQLLQGRLPDVDDGQPLKVAVWILLGSVPAFGLRERLMGGLRCFRSRASRRRAIRPISTASLWRRPAGRSDQLTARSCRCSRAMTPRHPLS